MTSFILGATSSGLPIPAYRFGPAGAPPVLVLGGVHGDEREGVEASLGLLQRWSVSFPFQLQVSLVPAFNVDGVLAGRRVNARGIDLNRNMSTKDWSSSIANPRYNPGPAADSEPETRALVSWLNQVQPVLVLSLHSWQPVLNTNGACLAEAAAIARWTGYPIQETIGYPTPGCLGTYCGIERNMPTLTYEIERGLATAEVLRIHLPAIEEGLKVSETAGRRSP